MFIKRLLFVVMLIGTQAAHSGSGDGPISQIRALGERSALMKDNISSAELAFALEQPIDAQLSCNLKSNTSRPSEFLWVVTHSDQSLVTLHLCEADDRIHVRSILHCGSEAKLRNLALV